VPSVQELPADVLLADELTLVREGLAALCNSIPGFRVVSQVGTAGAAFAEIQRLEPAVALLDLGLSDLAATEVIRRISRARSSRGPSSSSRGSLTSG